MGERIPNHQTHQQSPGGVVAMAIDQKVRQISRWQTIGMHALFIAMIALCSNVFGKEIETTAIGHGADENAALADALAKAVSQVNGVRSSMDVSTGKVELSRTATTTKGSDTTDETEKLALGTTADARLRSQGNVSRYEVMSSEVLANGETQTKVKAWVSRYEAPTYNAPGSTTARKRIAIFPATSAQSGFDFFGFVDGVELASQLVNQLEASTLETGRVSLLDRSTLAASLVELGLVGSDLTGATEKAKLRQFRGADLIVMTTIREARQDVQTWQIQSTGQQKVAVDMALEVDIRAVVPATGELLLTKRLTVRDAMDREDALTRIAELAAYDVVRIMTGSAPDIPRRERRPDESHQAEPTGPRRSGVLLPGDR